MVVFFVGWPSIASVFLPWFSVWRFQMLLFKTDHWIEEIAWDTWIFWVLVLLPLAVIYLASVAAVAGRSRYVQFFFAATLLWIVVVVLTVVSSSVVWIIGVLFLITIAAVGALIGRQIGWLAGTLMKGWLNRRAR